MNGPADDVELVESFAPVWSPAARVLVLGSMPGVASLRTFRYYAHPQNAFWRVVGHAVGAGDERGYAARVAALRKRGVALWDVARRCRRAGSLDSAIRDVEPNDVAGLVARSTALQAVLCNGRKAHELLIRAVLRPDPAALRGLPIRCLPSTSPANAGTPLREKERAWRDALQAAGVVLDPPASPGHD